MKGGAGGRGVGEEKTGGVNSPACLQVRRVAEAVSTPAREPARAAGRGDIPPVFQNGRWVSGRASRGGRGAKHFPAGRRGRCGAVPWGRTTRRAACRARRGRASG